MPSWRFLPSIPFHYFFLYHLPPCISPSFTLDSQFFYASEFLCFSCHFHALLFFLSSSFIYLISSFFQLFNSLFSYFLFLLNCFSNILSLLFLSKGTGRSYSGGCQGEGRKKIICFSRHRIFTLTPCISSPNTIFFSLLLLI